MEIDLLATFLEAPIPVQAVVAVLTIQAVLSLYVTIERGIMMIRSQGASTAFAAEAAKLMRRGDWEAMKAAADKAEGSHLARLMGAGLSVFLRRRRAGDGARSAASYARRAIGRKTETLSTQLNQGLNILASTGSTAPFVGLLGTVLGILFAFKEIEATGSGGIDTIGGSIGEALIVTGYGLVVAIPTVLLYNYLNGAISKYEMGLSNAAGELVDMLEVGGGYGDDGGDEHEDEDEDAEPDALAAES
jgi:biopolymer transport protein ExbB/TolQ